MSSTARDIPLIPVSYTLALVRAAWRHGVGAASLLEGTGVPESTLRDPDACLTVAESERIIERLVLLLRRPAFGFEYGMTLDFATHGLLGFATLPARNLRAYLQLLVDYLRIRIPLMAMQLEDRDGVVLLSIDDTVPLSAPARRFVADAYLGAVLAVAATHCRRIDIALSADARHARLLRLPLPGQVTAGSVQDRLELHFTNLDAEVPPPRERIQYTDELARVRIAREEGANLAARVRQCIMRDPARNATLEAVAHQLGLSARSLRRHLQAGSDSFSEIRNQIRQQFATRYLRHSSLSVDAIAERLGYSDPTSFARAFREWTGLSPGRYRRARDPEKPG